MKELLTENPLDLWPAFRKTLASVLTTHLCSWVRICKTVAHASRFTEGSIWFDALVFVIWRSDGGSLLFIELCALYIPSHDCNSRTAVEARPNHCMLLCDTPWILLCIQIRRELAEGSTP